MKINEHYLFDNKGPIMAGPASPVHFPSKLNENTDESVE